MAPCYLCRCSNDAWLALEICNRIDGKKFRLIHQASGNNFGVTTFEPRDIVTDTWFVCENGHLKNSNDIHRDEDISIVRLLGSSGGGKSQIVRALKTEVRAPTWDRREENNCNTTRHVDSIRDVEEPPPFKPGAIQATQLYKDTAMDRFIAFLHWIDPDFDIGFVSSFLTNAFQFEEGLSSTDPEQPERLSNRVANWGKVSAAYYIRSRTTYKESTPPKLHELFVPIIDLPGEMVLSTADRDIGDRHITAAIEQMKNTHHFLAIVDSISFTHLFEALTDPQRRACLRDRNMHGATGIQEHIRREAEQLLSTVLQMTRQNRALTAASIAVVITKADAIRRTLAVCQPDSNDPIAQWGSFWGDDQSMREDFITGASTSLLQLSHNWSSALNHMHISQNVMDLIQTIANTHHGKNTLAMEIAQSILRKFGDPREFWTFVTGSAPQSFTVNGKTYAVEGSRDYWFNSLYGEELQMRDVVSMVLATAILSAEFGQDVITSLTKRSNLRYVLTCTREFIQVDGNTLREVDNQGKMRFNGGVLQLLTLLLRDRFQSQR